MRNTIFLIVCGIAALAQRPIPPVPALPPLPPMPPMIDLLQLPDLEAQLAPLRDFQFQFDDARLAQINERVQTQVANAMRNVNRNLPFAIKRAMKV